MEDFKYCAGDKVVIRCPNPKKFPRFAASFNGRKAVVSRVCLYGELVLTLGDQQMNVDPNWVGRVK